MPFVATPQGIEVKLDGVQNGIPVVNVFHVKAPGTVSSADLDDAIAVFLGWWNTDLKQYMHTTYTLNAIIATDISVINGTQTILPLTTSNTGTAGSSAAAANAAVVMSWRTSSTGRSFRGRTYIGALSQAMLVDAQNISTSQAAGVATAGANLIDLLTAANLTLCVLSKFALGVARVAGLLTEILSVIVDTKVDSQRRRTAN